MNEKIIKDIKKKETRLKIKLIFEQIALITIFLVIWELSARYGLIDEFLISKPTDIWKLFINYIKSNELFKHIYISLLETVLGIIIGTFIGVIFGSILWYSKKLSKLLDPFLIILNALPKTALAPIIIIWVGTGIKGIVVVSISILIIVTIISSYNYFINVDINKIKMLESFKASKLQIYLKLIFPANLLNIISILKINIGLAWVGVIVGEFLVSRAGIGYLIMYGGQVFQLDLVMMGVFVLSICALVMYGIANQIEKLLIKKRGRKV